MILLSLIVLPLVGGVAAWALGKHRVACRIACLVALGFELVLLAQLWSAAAAGDHAGALARIGASGAGAGAAAEQSWIAEGIWPWIPAFGITVHLAVDGMSLLLLTLTAFLGIVAVGASWTEISDRTGFFHFCLMWTLAGVTGVFLSLDLFLFYFFWELMLIPMTFLIGIWGHEKRIFAALKFFLFTQASGLLMLLSILGVAIAAKNATRRLELRLRRPVGGADRPGRRHLAHARVLRRVRGQAAGGAAPHLAARRAHAGADRGLDPARRPPAQDRRLRPHPLRGAALPGGLGGVRADRDGAGRARHPLRRLGRLRADRLQAAGGLHQRRATSASCCSASTPGTSRRSPARCCR